MTAMVPFEPSNFRLELLDERPPDNVIEKRAGPGGKELSYLDHVYITRRLNEAFGPLNWRLTITGKASMSSGDHEEVIVEGYLEFRIDGIWERSHSGAGRGDYYPKSPNAAYADAYNSAESRLLRRCAFRLGDTFGLFLWDREEGITASRLASKELVANLQRIAKEVSADLETDLEVDFGQTLNSVTQDAAMSLIRRYNQQRQSERRK